VYHEVRRTQLNQSSVRSTEKPARKTLLKKRSVLSSKGYVTNPALRNCVVTKGSKSLLEMEQRAPELVTDLSLKNVVLKNNLVGADLTELMCYSQSEKMEIIDRHGSFISQSSVYCILNSYDLMTSPNYIVLSAADKVSAENQTSSRAMAAELYLF